MHSVILFVEDRAHEMFITALLQRLAAENAVAIRISPRSFTRGGSRSLVAMEAFFADLKRQRVERPDAIVVASDANCQGYARKRGEIEKRIPEGYRAVTLIAIPDPHIERWMLVDPAAFKKTFGGACSTYKQKCDRDRYKQILLKEIIEKTGFVPPSGGILYADDLIPHMNLDNIGEESLREFVKETRKWLKSLR